MAQVNPNGIQDERLALFFRAATSWREASIEAREAAKFAVKMEKEARKMQSQLVGAHAVIADSWLSNQKFYRIAMLSE